jgi:hypothetical protein
MRRDQVLLDTPYTPKTFTSMAYEPIIEIDVANRKLRGHVRFGTAARDGFYNSVPFEIDLTDAVLNQLMTFVHTRVVQQFAQVAGTREVVEVADQDAPPVIGLR